MKCLTLGYFQSGSSPADSGEEPPIAGKLEGALADWLGEGLVCGDGGEPFALRSVLVSQPVEQTQRLTLRSQPLLWPVTQAVDVVLAQLLRLE